MDHITFCKEECLTNCICKHCDNIEKCNILCGEDNVKQNVFSPFSFVEDCLRNSSTRDKVEYSDWIVRMRGGIKKCIVTVNEKNVK